MLLPLCAIILMVVSKDITDHSTVSHYYIRILCQLKGEVSGCSIQQSHTQIVKTDLRKLYFCKSVTFDPKSEMEKEVKGEFWQ